VSATLPCKQHAALAIPARHIVLLKIVFLVRARYMTNDSIVLPCWTHARKTGNTLGVPKDGWCATAVHGRIPVVDSTSTVGM
jgi:hypothetical protein